MSQQPASTPCVPASVKVAKSRLGIAVIHPNSDTKGEQVSYVHTGNCQLPDGPAYPAYPVHCKPPKTSVTYVLV